VPGGDVRLLRVFRFISRNQQKSFRMKLFKQFISPLVCISALVLANGCAVDSQSRPLGANHPASPSAASAPAMARPVLMTDLAVFTSRPLASDGSPGHEGHKEHEGHKGHDDHDGDGSHNHVEAE
jgi:hypothetical protein